MKIIFLDIDGVLNNDKCKVSAPSGCMFVEDNLVKRLQRIVYATDAKIVLSSTWRLGHYLIEYGITGYPDVYDYEELATKLLSFGIAIHGYTPILSDGDRAKEIAQYLGKQRDVESYVILDDIAVAGFEDHQVKTDSKYGLTDENVQKAIRILKG